MSGHRPGGRITPMHEPWRTTGIQWACILPDGEECAGGDMENPDRTKQVWAAARKHRDENPGKEHHIFVDRMQRVDLEPGDA